MLKLAGVAFRNKARTRRYAAPRNMAAGVVNIVNKRYLARHNVTNRARFCHRSGVESQRHNARHLPPARARLGIFRFNS